MRGIAMINTIEPVSAARTASSVVADGAKIDCSAAAAVIPAAVRQKWSDHKVARDRRGKSDCGVQYIADHSRHSQAAKAPRQLPQGA